MELSELRKKAAGLPMQPGVYIMRDKKREVIYVGKAKQLKNRVSSYFRAGAQHTPKVERMVSNVEDFDVIVADSEFEALMLECSLIKQHSPKYNILLKDDKGFCYIRVSGERYPRITAVYRKEDDGARYFGPYLGSFGVKQMVESACVAFGIPSCSKRFPQEIGKGRPCLNAHIGRCMAVCSGEISEEDYNGAVDSAVILLTKGSDAILKTLGDDMQRASEALEFERAARLRDVIAAIKKLDEGQKVVKSSEKEDADIFAFAGNERCVCAAVLKFRKGRLTDKDEHIIRDTSDIAEAREEFITHYYIEKKEIPKKVLCDFEFESANSLARMLTEQAGRSVSVSVPKRGDNRALVEMAYKNAADRIKRDFGRRSREEASLAELANLLGLQKPPERIEAYDISNYGEEAVAGMTVFVNGFPKKRDYRRFIIKSVVGVDDYASMSEALTRRANRLFTDSRGFNDKPDLILLDGGKGHLATVVQSLKGTALEDVPVFGMVKDDKHRTRGIVGEKGELEVAMHKGAFALVTTIQNETHKYTVEYQRNRHSKLAFRSALTEIDGVGENTAKKLLTHFKTVDAIKSASESELLEIKGMSKRVAAAIYSFFNA